MSYDVTRANLANMENYYAPGVIAVSEHTDEECSANPGDYWYLAPLDTLYDTFGEPMILVTRHASYQPV